MRKTEKELNLDLASTSATSRLCLWYFRYNEAMQPVLLLQGFYVAGTLATRVLRVWYFGYDEAMWSVLELRWMGSSQYSGYDDRSWAI